MPEPKILLINFSSETRGEFLELGYRHVDQAYIGEIHQNVPGKFYTDCYFMPHPPYEYDIFISQTELPADGKKYKNKDGHETPITNDIINIARKVGESYTLSICFIGRQSLANNLLIAGLPEITLSPADQRDSIVELADGTTFKIEELDKYFAETVNRIAGHHFYIDRADEKLKRVNAYRIPILVNKARKIIGEYGSQYWGSEMGTLPKYILLPMFSDNSKVAAQLLGRVERMIPTLLESVGSNSWIKSTELQPLEIQNIDSEISKIAEESERLIREAESKKPAILEKYSFFTKILTTDDEHYTGDDRLSVNVEKSLQFLGFKTVTTGDQKAEDGKRAEDLQISDSDGYKALCEVKGTINSNPAPKHIVQIATHLQRKGAKNGLLIINFNHRTHPFRRGKVYADSEDLIPDKDSGIGILSTVDLFRILTSVKENKLSKEQARNILKQPGRVEYPTI